MYVQTTVTGRVKIFQRYFSSHNNIFSSSSSFTVVLSLSLFPSHFAMASSSAEPTDDPRELAFIEALREFRLACMHFNRARHQIQCAVREIAPKRAFNGPSAPCWRKGPEGAEVLPKKIRKKALPAIDITFHGSASGAAFWGGGCVNEDIFAELTELDLLQKACDTQRKSAIGVHAAEKEIPAELTKLDLVQKTDDTQHEFQRKQQQRHDRTQFYSHAEAHHSEELEALGLPASPRPGFVLPRQYRTLRARLRIVDYLYNTNGGSAWLARWAASVGFEVSLGDSAALRQVGWECGAVAPAAAFRLLSAGDGFMDADTSGAVLWPAVRSQYDWLEQRDVAGHIEYNNRTFIGGSPRETTSASDGSHRTWFLGDEEVSHLYERCASASTLDQRCAFDGVQMLRFYLPFDTSKSQLPHEALVQSCKAFEPSYSPGEGANRNEISGRVLQHRLKVNEALVSTVTALVESSLPAGATIYGALPVRLELLSTELASTGTLNLSVSCAVTLGPGCSLVALQQCLQGTVFEVISGVTCTPTRVRSTSSYFPHTFTPRLNIAEPTAAANFPMIANRALVQRQIAKTMRAVAHGPPGNTVRRVAISNTDPHGAGTHWFTVCFEISKH